MSESSSIWVPMRSPTKKDIGRRVAYTGNRFPGGVWEYGYITSFNDNCIFVKYEGKQSSQATDINDLVWINPKAKDPVHLVPEKNA